MCAKDKALSKKTFHDIKDFITSGSSRLSSSTPRDPTARAPAGAGVTGPLGVPIGLPLGPLPLPGALQQEAAAGQEQQQQQEGKTGSRPRPPMRTYSRNRGSTR